MSIVHVCMCTRYVFGPYVGNQTSGIVISNGFELLCWMLRNKHRSGKNYITIFSYYSKKWLSSSN